MDDYFEILNKKLNKLTDEELDEILIESGLEQCPYDEENEE